MNCKECGLTNCCNYCHESAIFISVMLVIVTGIVIYIGVNGI